MWHILLWLSAAHQICFYFIDFQLNVQIFLPNFAFFTVKSPNVTQKLVSQENAFKKSKILRNYTLK